MRIFIYEYTCGPAMQGQEGLDTLRAEGTAMLGAVLEDFAQVQAVQAFTLVGDNVALNLPGQIIHRPRGQSEEAAFRALAARADWVLVIAPECNDILLNRCKWVEEVGTPLLGPSSEAIRLTGDKLALFQHLARWGIPTPESLPDSAQSPCPNRFFPAVWKPRYGAGSLATFLVPHANELPLCLEIARAEGWEGEGLLQPFVPGQAASVSFLTGPAQQLPLLPASQHLSSDERFHYLGGEVPLHPELNHRAVQLATRALQTLAGLRGYVGVDLVLGETTDGSKDVVIEINPRLTTSYVGLRALARTNLAEVMLKMAGGAEVPLPDWRKGRVTFRPDGEITFLDP